MAGVSKVKMNKSEMQNAWVLARVGMGFYNDKP